MPRTMRELAWMAGEKKRVLGEVAAYQIAWLAKMLSGVQLNVDEINPYKVEQQKSAEVLRIEAWQRKRRLRMSFKVLAGEA